ncbi:MAG: hypothetical protein KC519_15435 [Anaerolineae bacterium]|nr:hypothetical protein [Anaerolineae bacterium]
MKGLNELELQNLRWVQPSSWRREYELRSGSGELVGRMVRRGLLREIAEVEAVGNRWVFERKGFWNRRIEIHSAGTGDSPAEFDYHFVGGKLIFPDGRELTWRSSNFWSTQWAWTTEDGTPIVGFKTGGAFKLNSEISLDPELADQKALPLLIFLGWYLYLLFHDDSAAVVVVAGT